MRNQIGDKRVQESVALQILNLRLHLFLHVLDRQPEVVGHRERAFAPVDTNPAPLWIIQDHRALPIAALRDLWAQHDSGSRPKAVRSPQPASTPPPMSEGGYTKSLHPLVQFPLTAGQMTG